MVCLMSFKIFQYGRHYGHFAYKNVSICIFANIYLHVGFVSRIILAQAHLLNYASLGGRVVHSLLQLSERGPCHSWLVGMMKFASLEAHLGEAFESSISVILPFSLPLRGVPT